MLFKRLRTYYLSAVVSPVVLVAVWSIKWWAGTEMHSVPTRWPLTSPVEQWLQVWLVSFVLKLALGSKRGLIFHCAAFLHPVVHDDVAIFVFDPEPSGGVARFLPAVSVDCLHGTVWILPPLVVSRVNLFLACVEMDLLGAVPERGSTHSDQGR